MDETSFLSPTYYNEPQTDPRNNYFWVSQEVLLAQKGGPLSIGYLNTLILLLLCLTQGSFYSHALKYYTMRQINVYLCNQALSKCCHVKLSRLKSKMATLFFRVMPYWPRDLATYTWTQMGGQRVGGNVKI